MRIPIHSHEREIVLLVLAMLGFALAIGLMVNARQWWPGLPNPVALAGRTV